MIVRKLKVKDWEIFKKTRLEALKLEPQAFGDSYGTLAEEPESYWIDVFSSEKQVWYGVFDESKLVGIGSVKFAQSKKFSHIARLSGIFVKKEYRGKGFGKILFEALISEAFKNRKIIKLKLSVNKSQSSAIKLYKSCGFKIIAEMEKEFMIDNKYFDAYLMELIRLI